MSELYTIDLQRIKNSEEQSDYLIQFQATLASEYMKPNLVRWEGGFCLHFFGIYLLYQKH